MYALLVQEYEGPKLIWNRLYRDSSYTGILTFETYEDALKVAKQESYVNDKGNLITFIVIMLGEDF